MVGTVLTGVFPAGALTTTIPVLLVFAGLARFIAGLFAFRRANGLAATAFCSFGSFNVLIALFFIIQARGMLTATGDPMVLQGFVLLSFGFIALALTVAALPTNAMLVITLGLLAVGYILTGIPALASASGKNLQESDRRTRRLLPRRFCVLCLLHRHGADGERQLATQGPAHGPADRR